MKNKTIYWLIGIILILSICAVAYGYTGSGSFNSATATTVTVSHTFGTADTVTIACIEDVDNTLTGVALGSQQFTQIGSTLNVGGGYTSAWIATSSGGFSSGSHNVVATRTTSIQIMKVAVASYPGLATDGVPTNVHTSQPHGSSVSDTITPTNANSLVVLCSHEDGNIDVINAGSGTTLRTPQENVRIADTDALVSGATTLNETTSDGSSDWGMVMFALPQSSGGGGGGAPTSTSTLPISFTLSGYSTTTATVSVVIGSTTYSGTLTAQ